MTQSIQFKSIGVSKKRTRHGSSNHKLHRYVLFCMKSRDALLTADWFELPAGLAFSRTCETLRARSALCVERFPFIACTRD